MRTTTLLDETLTGVKNGDAVVFHMPEGSRGILNCRYTASAGLPTTDTMIQMRLQGRLSSRMEWVTVDISSTTDDVSLKAAMPAQTFQDIQVFPEMRISVLSIHSNVTSITIQCEVSN
jgi:HSP20 family molecular chaperone IbpA